MTETPREITIKQEEPDVIDAALHSIEKEEKLAVGTEPKDEKNGSGSFASIGEVLYKKPELRPVISNRFRDKAKAKKAQAAIIETANDEDPFAEDAE
jgi:hypothetical protein